jgi:hypothetical protein
MPGRCNAATFMNNITQLTRTDGLGINAELLYDNMQPYHDAVSILQIRRTLAVTPAITKFITKYQY